MNLMESLLNLNRVDGQLRGLRSRLDSAERYLNAQTRLAANLTEAVEELQTRKRQTQAKIGNTETEIRAIDERIEKLRDELNTAVNQKQYQAVLNELNVVKESRAELEDRELGDMEQMEQIEAELKTQEEQLAERIKVREKARADLDERTAEIGDRLNEVQTRRDEAAALVPASELAAFDGLANDYDGEAMAAVNEIDRKSREYACNECHMHLPFEMISLLTSGVSALVFCTACGRILYMAEEIRGALAK